MKRKKITLRQLKLKQAIDKSRRLRLELAMKELTKRMRERM